MIRRILYWLWHPAECPLDSEEALARYTLGLLIEDIQQDYRINGSFGQPARAGAMALAWVRMHGKALR